MDNHGTIGEYDPQKEDWTSYSERLQEYFTANDVDAAAKKRTILLSVVGSSTYVSADQEPGSTSKAN